MNEKAERINGWAAMIGVIAAMGSYAVTGQIIPGVWQFYKVQVTQLQEVIKMILLATCLLGAYILIIASLTEKDVDDDDHFDGGMMMPVPQGI